MGNRILKIVLCLLGIVVFALQYPVQGYAKKFTIVIDAGHGGKDKGALGAKSYEKDINLNVALKFGKLIEEKMSDVKVVYTRVSDVFLTLQQRADISNKASADLFVSIHTNSLDEKIKGRASVCGASTYVLGLHRSEENVLVATRENSVIELEHNKEVYKDFDPNSDESYIIYEITQGQNLDKSIAFATLAQEQMVSLASRVDKGVRQAGFYVLAKTYSPSVLVELDYICNPSSEHFLTSNEGSNKLAKSLFNAFKSYKESQDSRLKVAK